MRSREAEPSSVRRHFHVFDGWGEHLGSFPTFQAAHDWAHLQSALGGVPTPLDVEDRQRRVTRRITRDRCQPITWEASRPDPPADGAGAPGAGTDEASGAARDGSRTNGGGGAGADGELADPGADDAGGGAGCAAPGTLDPDLSPDAYVARRPPLPRAPLDAQLPTRPGRDG